MGVSRPDHPSVELARLRVLVGPSEASYEALIADRDRARDLAKSAAMEVGELRGQLTEMSVQLSRARQDQDLLLRTVEMNGVERMLDLGKRRWTSSVSPRLKRLNER